MENVEYWSARDLQEVFDYTQWKNFEKVIQKAAISVENTSESVELDFVEVSKSYILPNGGGKIIKDYALTRYVCYLIAQNGDPSKEEIAFAQSYFAVQTRKQELIEKCYLESERVTTREKIMSQFIKQMKSKLGVPKNKSYQSYKSLTIIPYKKIVGYSRRFI
ncbi:BRO family protein [Bernardetia sp. OM2101]|uniref:BRO family protein n=1 Tax=Bernardetia sp. OM2101 TaxID=3344876 RepID=UPI0035D0B9A4